jgi:succinoglycan biosynthesis protein ExoM
LVASVVICTYNRPAMFEAALLSCRRDATRRGMAYDIIVADNGPAGHAADIVGRLPPGGPPVRVLRVTPPNIALARNAGLCAATAPLVAFMDDDLELEPGWLDALVDTLTASGADVVVGPVRGRFPGGVPPSWDPTGASFTRELSCPDGTPIAATGPAKPPGFALSTASSLWRAATCFTDPAPFDAGFGASGGEDCELFMRLERRGCRFAWCAGGGVRETLPPSRLRLGYQLHRAYNGAQVYAAASIKNAPAPRVKMLDIGLRGLIQAAIFGPAAVLLALFARLGASGLGARAARFGFIASGGCGKATWWRRGRIYHTEQSV